MLQPGFCGGPQGSRLIWEFPGSPVVRTWLFHCGGPRFRELKSHKLCSLTKREKKKKGKTIEPIDLRVKQPNVRGCLLNSHVHKQTTGVYFSW